MKYFFFIMMLLLASCSRRDFVVISSSPCGSSYINTAEKWETSGDREIATTIIWESKQFYLEGTKISPKMIKSEK